MLIRLGYEIAIECPHQMPVISLLEIDPRPPGRHQAADASVLTSPHVRKQVYTRLFGNICRRFMAPEGGFRILYDAVIEDSGEPDEVNTLAGETPVERSAATNASAIPARQPLLRDRPSGRPRLGAVRPHAAGGWARVQAICDYVHNRLSFGYGYARATRTAAQAMRSGSASAAISPISPSRSAAA